LALSDLPLNLPVKSGLHHVEHVPRDDRLPAFPICLAQLAVALTPAHDAELRRSGNSHPFAPLARQLQRLDGSSDGNYSDRWICGHCESVRPGISCRESSL
jgi:hypothetical protein